MKKFLSLIILSLIISVNLNIDSVYSIKIVSQKEQEVLNKEINLGEMFIFFGGMYDGKIPKTYKYININIGGINNNKEVKESIKKLIYVDKLKNVDIILNIYKKVNAYYLYKFAEKIFGVDLITDSEINTLKNRKAIKKDFDLIKERIQIYKNNFSFDNEYIDLTYKKEIFLDVYKTIKKSHYDRDKISDIDLIDGAIKGLADGTGDKFTSYFPQIENKNFQDILGAEFEGIGSYVEMEKPGLLKIVSPIPGSPSEKSGLKGGDIILKVDGKKITKIISLNKAVSWIKGPKGTSVVLTIYRDGKTFDVKVIRDKIVIKEVEYKKLDSKTFYIKMTIFGANISKEFKESLEALKKEKGIKKVIFDLRNNGGGYLDEVSDMLGYFISKGNVTAVVKYLNGEQNYYSKGYDLIDFSKYKIVILQNAGTASASEIFIGTIKDYFPKSIIIGEQSYGKGSVQSIKSYKDGSSFKYTVARWFTGKSKTGINGIGITPDINLEFDFEKFNKNKFDNQLEKAKSIR